MDTFVLKQDCLMATLTTLLCKIYQTAPNFPPKNKMLLGRRTRRRATISTQKTACQTMQISKRTAKSWHASRNSSACWWLTGAGRPSDMVIGLMTPCWTCCLSRLAKGWILIRLHKPPCSRTTVLVDTARHISRPRRCASWPGAYSLHGHCHGHTCRSSCLTR